MKDALAKQNTSRTDLCSGPFFGKIIRFALPIFFTGILQLLFNAADLVVVGNFCGDDAVGAVGATGALINLLVNLFMGLSVGAGVCVAHGIGAKNDRAVHCAVHTALPAAAICGLVLTAVGMVFSTPLLEIMDTPAEVLPLSSMYLRIYFAGSIPMLLYNFGASILRSAGDTKSPLIFLCVAGVVNVLLNLLFVIAFDLNVAGVALATTLSQTVSCVLVLIALVRRTDACRLLFSKLHIYKSTLVKIIRVGLPAGIQGSLFSFSNVIIQSSINSFGNVVLAGNSAASNLEGFVYMSMNAFHQTALTFTGQNMGARKLENIGKVFRICLFSVLADGILLGGLVCLFSEPLLSIYLSGEPEAMAAGVLRLHFVCLPYFLCGLMDVTTGVLRGMGASVGPMVVTVGGICGFRLLWIATVFNAEPFHSLGGLLVSYPISWALTFLVLLGFFFLLLRKQRRAMAA